MLSIILILNALLYIFTLIIFIIKKRYSILGGVILLLYSISATGCIFLFNHPLSEGLYETISIFPFIYLYVALLIVFYPILRLNEKQIILQKTPLGLEIACVITCIPILVNIIFNSSTFINNITEIITDPLGGANLYANTAYVNRDYAGHRGINILGVSSGISSFFVLFFLSYYLTIKKQKRYITICLAISSFFAIFWGIQGGSRGFIKVFVINFAWFLFMSKFYSKIIKKYIKVLLIFCSFIAFFLFLAITTSRFFSEQKTIYYDYPFLSYASQSFLNFNNYGLNPGGCRYGDRTACLFKILLLDSQTRSFQDRIDKYDYMRIAENSYYTFVADFTLDYTPYFAILLFIGISFVFKKLIGKHNKFSIQNLLSLYMLFILCTYGYSLYPYSDIGGNLKIISFIFIYVYFSILNKKRIYG